MARRELAPVDEARRAFLVRALGSGLLIGGLGWQPAASAGWFGRRPKQLPGGQSFFDLSGEVRVNGERASRATRVRAGDQVAVGPGGQAIFAVGDNAYLLRERSVLELSGRELLVQSMQLLSGALLGCFGHRRREAQQSLRTPTATIGIRGTGVYVEAQPERSYVCNCYGAIDLAVRQAPEIREAITATHHDAPRWVLGGEAPAILPAPFINHEDLELRSLEAVVGREVPFGPGDLRYGGPRRRY